MDSALAWFSIFETTTCFHSRALNASDMAACRAVTRDCLVLATIGMVRVQGRWFLPIVTTHNVMGRKLTKTHG
jgi:hypothetical protein